jgi:putative DNA primase/helicase
MICGEDDPHDTIRPRLDAHRADVSRIHLLTMVRRVAGDGKAQETMFTLADVAALESALVRLPDCKLIVIDPIGSYLGGDVDGNSDNGVRSLLAPVAKLAEKYGCAVLIVAHRRKAGGNSADDLTLGSRAFGAIARSIWHVSRDRDTKCRRLMLPGKNNLSAETDGLAFSIAGDPPQIEWEKEPVSISADELLAQENGFGNDAKPGPQPEARSRAVEWLREELSDGGEHAIPKLQELAKAAGLVWRTVQRASRDLGVKCQRASFGGGYSWRLPTLPDEPVMRAKALEEGLTWQPGEQGKSPTKSGDFPCRETCVPNC